MKYKRHRKILHLINTEDIATQEELSQRLVDLGYKVTQATVSRDIKELKLVKVPSDRRGSKYGVLSMPSETVDNSAKLNTILIEAVMSCDYANNIVIVKTIQGMAQGVAFAMDSLEDPSVMGTIAGDDTIMVVTKTEAGAEGLTSKINNLLVKE